MAKEILGETIDIHGGGMDLLFPHHENERAQSEALFNKTFVHYWLHNEFITINKEKMSKSLKNFVTLKDVFSQCDPMVLRYFFLQHHYRTPIDFSPDELNSAQTAYKRLITHLSNIGGQERQIDINKIDNTLEQEIMNSLCDDINTPKCLGLIFDVLSDIKKEKSLGIFIKNILNNILGLTLASIKEKELEITPQIETLLYQREQARQAKDWASADAIRDKLVSLGYKVQDKKLK
jgi:cysteinyl-tRNA synthetase